MAPDGAPWSPPRARVGSTSDGQWRVLRMLSDPPDDAARELRISAPDGVMPGRISIATGARCRGVVDMNHRPRHAAGLRQKRAGMAGRALAYAHLMRGATPGDQRQLDMHQHRPRGQRSAPVAPRAGHPTATEIAPRMPIGQARDAGLPANGQQCRKKLLLLLVVPLKLSVGET